MVKLRSIVQRRMLIRDGRESRIEKRNLMGRIDEREKEKEREGKEEKAWTWVPHPRTGIYIPKGQEWVMKDVPETAASLEETYWLREIDGVEKPDPDKPTPSHFHADF